VINTGEIPTKAATPKWSTDCIEDLAWMTHAMSRTADVSGTGKIIKPDLALMATDPWAALMKKLATSQATYNVPLGTAAVELAKFPTIRVGGLDVVFDENVPDSSGAEERVFVLDSKAFVIETCNTKKEGLMEAEWKQKDPEVIGGVGVYKTNMGLRCDTPHSVGVLLACNE